MPTFALGFVWHLMLFHGYYERLAIYRKDIIILFGFLSMLIQALLIAWVYQRAFAQRNSGLMSRGLSYAAFGAVLSWSNREYKRFFGQPPMRDIKVRRLAGSND